MTFQSIPYQKLQALQEQSKSISEADIREAFGFTSVESAVKDYSQPSDYQSVIDQINWYRKFSESLYQQELEDFTQNLKHHYRYLPYNKKSENKKIPLEEKIKKDE
jgi:hypothetical protein